DRARRAAEAPTGPSEVAVAVRFERAGEAAVRALLAHVDASGEVSATQLPELLEPLVDSLRLATHAEQLEPGAEAPAVQSPVEGGVVTCLEVRARDPLPALEDPTARSSLSRWLRALGRVDPARLVSVRIAEVLRSPDASAALRPLHS